MKHVRNFQGFDLNESNVTHEAMVTIDMAHDTIKTWSDTLAGMAEIAPNCLFHSFVPFKDYWEVVIIGPRMECEGLADYWNNLTGGSEVAVEPFRGPRTRY